MIKIIVFIFFFIFVLINDKLNNNYVHLQYEWTLIKKQVQASQSQISYNSSTLSSIKNYFSSSNEKGFIVDYEKNIKDNKLNLQFKMYGKQLLDDQIGNYNLTNKINLTFQSLIWNINYERQSMNNIQYLNVELANLSIQRNIIQFIDYQQPFQSILKNKIQNDTFRLIFNKTSDTLEISDQIYVLKIQPVQRKQPPHSRILYIIVALFPLWIMVFLIIGYWSKILSIQRMSILQLYGKSLDLTIFACFILSYGFNQTWIILLILSTVILHIMELIIGLKISKLINKTFEQKDYEELSLFWNCNGKTMTMLIFYVFIFCAKQPIIKAIQSYQFFLIVQFIILIIKTLVWPPRECHIKQIIIVNCFNFTVQPLLVSAMIQNSMMNQSIYCLIFCIYFVVLQVKANIIGRTKWDLKGYFKRLMMNSYKVQIQKIVNQRVQKQLKDNEEQMKDAGAQILGVNQPMNDSETMSLV